MNRRNFISGLLASGASFMVLPGAGRLWNPAVRPERWREIAALLVSDMEQRAFVNRFFFGQGIDRIATSPWRNLPTIRTIGPYGDGSVVFQQLNESLGTRHRPVL